MYTCRHLIECSISYKDFRLKKNLHGKKEMKIIKRKHIPGLQKSATKPQLQQMQNLSHGNSANHGNFLAADMEESMAISHAQLHEMTNIPFT